MRLRKLLVSRIWPQLHGWRGLLPCVIKHQQHLLMLFSVLWRKNCTEVLMKSLKNLTLTLLVQLQLPRYLFDSTYGDIHRANRKIIVLTSWFHNNIRWSLLVGFITCRRKYVRNHLRDYLCISHSPRFLWRNGKIKFKYIAWFIWH